MARRSSRSPPGVAMWVREMEGWSLIESPRSFRGDHWTLNIGILEFKVKEELTCDGRSTYVQGAPRLITDDDLHRSGIFARSNLVTTHNTKNMYIRNGRVLSIDICASIFTYREVCLSPLNVTLNLQSIPRLWLRLVPGHHIVQRGRTAGDSAYPLCSTKPSLKDQRRAPADPTSKTAHPWRVGHQRLVEKIANPLLCLFLHYSLLQPPL